MNEQRTAIVTGASSGIGRAIAVALSEHGFGVTITARTADALSETAALMANESAHECVADLSDASSPHQIVTESLARWKHVDVLVNNAGIAPVCDLPDTDPNLIESTMRINAIAPVELVRALWHHWSDRAAGCLLNISSLSASDPFPGFLAYGMSKAALDGLTRSVHVEGAAMGIRSFGLALGAVETALLRRIVSEEQFPASQTMAPSEVATKVIELIDSTSKSDLGTTTPFYRE